MSAASLTSGGIAWARKRLFGSWFDTVITLLVVLALYEIVPVLVRWAFIDANLDATSIRECRATGGACWAFLIQKARLILFGLYSGPEWRPTVAVGILLSLSGRRRARLAQSPHARRRVRTRRRRDSRPDAGRRLRPDAGFHPHLGRAAADAVPGDDQPRLRLPARHPARARPPLRIAGDPHPLDHLYRGGPRRSR